MRIKIEASISIVVIVCMLVWVLNIDPNDKQLVIRWFEVFVSGIGALVLYMIWTRG